jgi:hypothetical protein
MEASYIEQRLAQLKELKLPQLNKKSRAHKDWKDEINRLTKILNKLNYGED